MSGVTRTVSESSAEPTATNSTSPAAAAEQEDPLVKPKSTRPISGGKEQGDADAERVDGDPQTDLQCPICMDFFIDPTLTDCAHAFCSFCIHYWFQNRGRSICPQCRNTVELVTPSAELREKVEKYVAATFGAGQLQERERTKMRRETEMNLAAARLLPIREQFSQFGDDLDDLFWSFTIQQPDGVFPLSSSNFSRSLGGNFGEPNAGSFYVNAADVRPCQEFQRDLHQFEYRLGRAERAYASMVAAQREMNNELVHLRSISTRLEAYDMLRHGMGGYNNLCPACTVEISHYGGSGAVDADYSSGANEGGISTLDSMNGWPWLPCTSYQYFPAPASEAAVGGYCGHASCLGSTQQHSHSHTRLGVPSREVTMGRGCCADNSCCGGHEETSSGGNLESPRMDQLSRALNEQFGAGMSLDSSFAGIGSQSTDPTFASIPTTGGFTASISIESDLVPDYVPQMSTERNCGSRHRVNYRAGRTDSPSFSQR